MIQRIQTVYLIISALLIGLLFAWPFAEIAKDGAIYTFNFKGILLDGAVQQGGLVISVVLALIMASHVFAVFSFKNRPQQVKIIFFTILMMLGLLGLLVFFTYFSFSGAQISYKTGVALPLVAIILDYMAIRGIKKDEALIRSIDRIR